MKAKYLEGYWDDGDGKYPKPVEYPHKWGKSKFLAHLRAVQKESDQKHYKGYSYCRCCDNDRNGTSDFTLGSWRWPEGFEHYIERHKVRPSLAFEMFIERQYEKIKKERGSNAKQINSNFL